MAEDSLPQRDEVRHKFVVIEIIGEPKMVDSYASLLAVEIEGAVKFFRAMYVVANKRVSKLPVVKVYERQAG